MRGERELYFNPNFKPPSIIVLMLRVLPPSQISTPFKETDFATAALLWYSVWSFRGTKTYIFLWGDQSTSRLQYNTLGAQIHLLRFSYLYSKELKQYDVSDCDFLSVCSLIHSKRSTPMS